MIGPDNRIALLMHGYLDDALGKLGHGMLRYSPAELVAVVDRCHAGRDAAEVTGIVRSVPVVASVEEAAAMGADVLIVGIAPPGGLLPEDWRYEIIRALEAGMSVVNPLHGRWSDDPAISSHAGKGNWIWDMRTEPPGLQPATGAAASLPCKRLLTVGTDMAVGKMTASLELVAEARKRGIPCEFIATGQVGMCIAGSGVAIDGVRVDYAAGAIEREVLERANRLLPNAPNDPNAPNVPLIVIEGQGALCHPAASANLALMRGAMPTHLLMVHRAGQTALRRMPEFPIPSLAEMIGLYEDLASCGGSFPRPKTIGIALNCAELSEEAALAEIARLAEETGLPVTDPVRFGCDALLDALIA